MSSTHEYAASASNSRFSTSAAPSHRPCLSGPPAARARRGEVVLSSPFEFELWSRDCASFTVKAASVDVSPHARTIRTSSNAAFSTIASPSSASRKWHASTASRSAMSCANTALAPHVSATSLLHRFILRFASAMSKTMSNRILSFSISAGALPSTAASSTRATRPDKDSGALTSILALSAPISTMRSSTTTMSVPRTTPRCLILIAQPSSSASTARDPSQSSFFSLELAKRPAVLSGLVRSCAAAHHDGAQSRKQTLHAGSLEACAVVAKLLPRRHARRISRRRSESAP
mmetsp:Transcript_5908/g.15692  ORF Transcript_5908/g.15692 Transcript_5908/m.15692 type:complete len:290 (+) Transcript_5908:342-1211(+)